MRNTRKIKKNKRRQKRRSCWPWLWYRTPNSSRPRVAGGGTIVCQGRSRYKMVYWHQHNFFKTCYRKKKEVPAAHPALFCRRMSMTLLQILPPKIVLFVSFCLVIIAQIIKTIHVIFNARLGAQVFDDDKLFWLISVTLASLIRQCQKGTADKSSRVPQLMIDVLDAKGDPKVWLYGQHVEQYFVSGLQRH